jgi:hypothetical protein
MSAQQGDGREPSTDEHAGTGKAKSKYHARHKATLITELCKLQAR